jgi:hypothetical protein
MPECRRNRVLIREVIAIERAKHPPALVPGALPRYEAEPLSIIAAVALAVIFAFAFPPQRRT